MRFIVSEHWVKSRTSLGMDDQLYLKLNWNGSQSRNYPMEQNGAQGFEAALQIPESAADIEWSITKNYKDKISGYNKITIDLDGLYLDL